MEPGCDRKAGRWTRMRLDVTTDEYGSILTRARSAFFHDIDIDML